MSDKIRIDMDFASNPVWFSQIEEDGEYFVNGEIDELDLTDDTIKSLQYYKRMWYILETDQNAKIEDPIMGSYSSLDEYVYQLALRVKSELNDTLVYVWDSKNLCNKLV